MNKEMGQQLVPDSNPAALQALFRKLVRAQLMRNVRASAKTILLGQTLVTRQIRQITI